MKTKYLLILLLTGILLMFQQASVWSQQDTTTTTQTGVEEETLETVYDEYDLAPGEVPVHKKVKKLFIEGGAIFMSFVLICLILGLAFAIERIIYLSLANTNTKKLLEKIESSLEKEGVEAAKEVCRNTRGPAAGIFYQGLDRFKEGIEMVEKSIISYGSVQMGLLERGLTWIALFIALAPMLGFLGTVIGMYDAFNSIYAMGEISPATVANGIKIALITTVGGLIVAIILQLFYNLILSKIDSIVNNMEDSSISFIDILIKYQAKTGQL
jgi:biopolymer transport protein ExbB